MASRRSWLWILVLFLAMVLVFWTATRVLNRMVLGQSPSLAAANVLEIHLSGTLVERPGRLFGSEAFGSLSLREIDQALRAAAEDDRVRGVVLRVGPLLTGFGKVQEIREALHVFRRSGKKVVALLELGTVLDLYVASGADTVVQVPTGALILGLASRTQYYRELLDTLGVEVDTFHTGPYKTAMNPYTETEMTAEERAAIESLIDDIYRQLLDDIGESRGIGPEAVAAAMDRTLLSGREALEAGLVDELGFDDRVRELMGETARDARWIGTRDYLRTQSSGSLFALAQPVIALVHVDGMIVPGDPGESPFGGGGVSGGDTAARHLRQARLDSRVRAIVLRVDSPGGVVSASDVILREAILAAAEKPLLVSMSDVAASGGYWIATAASRVFADAATYTGSIGVVSSRFNLASTYEMMGVGNSVVKRGRNADIFVDSERLTDEQRRILSESVQEHYRTFVTKVATARGLEESEVEQLAAGRVWTGRQALDRGLVDEIGGLHRALLAARDEAGLGRREDVDIEVYPESPSLFQQIFGMFSMARASGIETARLRALRDAAPLEAAAARWQAEVASTLASSGRAWALLVQPVPVPAR